MMFKSHGAVVLALLTAACGVPKPKPTEPQGAIAPAKPPPVSAVVYRIDPSQSELRILVYRAGPMAPFGHNHVIVNRSLGGSIEYAGAVASASFALTIPAAGFVIDDVAVRREEGADFADEVSEDARSGTLRNMLSTPVLDAAHFPEITVRSVTTTDALEATLAVNVAGHESTITVPFSADLARARLTASGAVTLSQSTLGLTPFSVFLGALRVQDEMRLKFKFVAVAN